MWEVVSMWLSLVVFFLIFHFIMDPQETIDKLAKTFNVRTSKQKMAELEKRVLILEERAGDKHTD